MLSPYRLQRLALASLVSSLTYITINTAHAEVASVYGGPDGLCGSLTANGERVNCAAMTAAQAAEMKAPDRGAGALGDSRVYSGKPGNHPSPFDQSGPAVSSRQ